MTLKPVDGWQLSPRVRIARDSRVRFCGGGPCYGDHRLTLPGVFRVLGIVRAGRRVYLEVNGESGVGGTYTVLVEGRPYRRHGLLWRPYKVRRVSAGAGRNAIQRTGRRRRGVAAGVQARTGEPGNDNEPRAGVSAPPP